MPAVYQEPEERAGHSSLGGTIQTHPAYAQIQASRVSGQANLYGSEFQHHAYITVTVSLSEMRRSLSNDWPHARGELIEVAMSEAQWASFVSSMNVGEGTLCTLQHIQGQQIPQIPAPQSKNDQFKKEILKDAQAAFDELDALKAQIDGLKISQKQKEELLKQAGRVKSTLADSMPFVVDQHGEYMERTIERAKAEINAYLHNTVMRSGVASLGDELTCPPQLSLD